MWSLPGSRVIHPGIWEQGPLSRGRRRREEEKRGRDKRGRRREGGRRRKEGREEMERGNLTCTISEISEVLRYWPSSDLEIESQWNPPESSWLVGPTNQEETPATPLLCVLLYRRGSTFFFPPQWVSWEDPERSMLAEWQTACFDLLKFELYFVLLHWWLLSSTF